MALSPENFEIFKRHIEKHGATDQPCPVCGTKSWTVENIIAPTGLHETSGGAMLGAGVTPLLILACEKCFYARTFAWLGIKAGASGG